MNAIVRHWDVAKAALVEERARSRRLIRTDETAFLPAALEVIERPVSPTARITTYVFLIGLAMTICWLVFGRVDVVASALGRVIPDDNVKLVQPVEAGIVRAIHVRDGQLVQAGQPLVDLDPTVSTAEATQAEKALETALLDAARSRAVLAALDGSALIMRAPEGTPAAVIETQRRLAAAQYAEIVASISARRSDQRAALAARAEAEGQATKLAETIPLLDQQLAANEDLLKEGYVGRLKVIEMRRQRQAAVRDRDIAVETARRADAQLSSAGSGYGQSRAEARARALADLAKAEAEANLRREEIVKSRQRTSLQILRAPVTGRVTQLAVHTVGGVVEPTKPIMVVVPQHGRLVIEAKVLNKDAGFIAVGQPVAAKMDAFPFTRFGTVPGRIAEISSDAIEDEKLGLVYIVRATLGSTAVNRGDRLVPLVPGMAATLDIKTGKRTILSYLVSPIDEARFQAGRER